MSAAYVTIVGKMKTADGTEQDVTISGMADVIAFTPGSPPPRPHPEPPLGIWGPTDPRPTPPIALPPGYGRPPLGIWGPTDPRPWNPIAGIPGIPGYEPPKPGEEPRVPKFEPKVAWTAETGWVVVFVPTEGTLVPTPSA